MQVEGPGTLRETDGPTSMYYILDGHQVIHCPDIGQWINWFSTADRRVRLTEIGCLRISTVFLGLNHNFSRNDSPPMLFETMVFDQDTDLYQERCSTWAEAEEMHAQMVNNAIIQVRNADSMFVHALLSPKTT